MIINLGKFLDAVNISQDARKRARSIGSNWYQTKGKHVGGGKRLAPTNPLPSGNKTDHRQHLSQAGILKKEVERLQTANDHLQQAAVKADGARQHAETTAATQRRLKLHAEKELRRLLRNLDQSK